MEKKLTKLIYRLLNTASEAARYSDKDRKAVATEYAYAAEALIKVLIMWKAATISKEI